MKYLTLSVLASVFSLLPTDNHRSGYSANASDHIEVNFIVHGAIADDEKDQIEEKIQQIGDKLFQDFQLTKGEVFNLHFWSDYNDYLQAQEENIGTRFPGSLGYVIGPNDLAICHNANMAENAEHEFAHAASLHLNPQFGNNPRWLWEAVAIYESDEFTHPARLRYLSAGNFPGLAELNEPPSPASLNRIYEVGYLLSEYIIEEWGRAKYLELIVSSGDIPKTLSVSNDTFEKGWKEFVMNKYPQE